MILTYKYRIKDRSAKKRLLEHAHAVNQVWNYCNALQKETEDKYHAGAKPRKWLTSFEFSKLCNGVGKELGIRQQTVQLVCEKYAMNRSIVKHSIKFRPSFGSKRALGWVPFTNQSRKIVGDSIDYFGKVYRLFGISRRPLPKNIKGGNFFEDSLGRWYVCFHVEIERKQFTGDNNSIGIDLGLTSFATISNGDKIESPRYYQKFENKLKSADRSCNKRKQRTIQLKIKNCRNDFLHKLSTKLAGQNALIAVGNVNAKQLSSSRRLAKSVYDAGWSAFRFMLSYKTQTYIEVDEKFTTRTCSACGNIGGPVSIAGLGIRRWKCSNCGENHDRDVNAARNILIAALSTQRPVEGSLLEKAG